MTNLDKELLVLCGLEHKEHIVPKKQKSKKTRLLLHFCFTFLTTNSSAALTSFRSCKPNH